MSFEAPLLCRRLSSARTWTGFPAKRGASPFPEMDYVRIRNLERYQHYKKRNPPWVKLYQDFLTDDRLMALPDAAKWHAVALTLIASRCENQIPADPLYLTRAMCASTPVDLQPLLDCGWLERCDASTMLARPGSDASKPLAPYSREVRGEKKGIASAMLAEHDKSNGVFACPNCFKLGPHREACWSCGATFPEPQSLRVMP